MSKRYLVIGAGISGAVIARGMADGSDSTVEVWDSRSHVAGNCHTGRDPKTGIMIHEYGPHIFNTDREDIWAYVNRFATFRPYRNQVKACTSRGIFSLPINLHTINQFYRRTFSPQEAREFISRLPKEGIEEPQNLEEQAIKFVGRDLYETFIKGYTEKQWGCDPKLLPASIIKRMPIRFNYDDNYYHARLQGIPEEGYTEMIKSILDHPRMTVTLGKRFERGMEAGYDHVFYCGPIDAFFDYKLGRLGYRTVTFERIDAEGDFQGNAVINYPGLEVAYTRIHEHKHFAPWESHERTVAFREYSQATKLHDTPYYPMRLPEDLKRLEAYQAHAQEFPRFTFVGRLGTYQYMDMDDAIAEGLQVVETELSQS